WPFQDKYPGRGQLEQLPEAEKPSPRLSFQKHGIDDALKRLSSGTWEVSSRFFFPEAKLQWSGLFRRSPEKKWEQPLAHRGIYLILLGALCAILAASRKLGMSLATMAHRENAASRVAMPRGS